MKRENRQYEIRSATWDEVEGSQYYNLPLLIEYKDKKQILPCGLSDDIDVMRDANGDMWVLSTHYSLDYAGITLVDFEDIATETFIDNVTVQLDTGDSGTRFFDYTINTQADILAKFIDC